MKVSNQSQIKNIDINIYVLDYDFKLIDEISGVATSANISVDADSDIRRTATISMVLNDFNSKVLTSTDKFNLNKPYNVGDVVVYNKMEYQCIYENPTGVVGILPTNSDYWKPYLSDAEFSSMKYWKAGNPYWFDKYIKIEIGEEILYQNNEVFDMGKTYISGDTVWYNDDNYVCTTQCAGIPPINNLYWTKLVKYEWHKQGVFMVNTPTILYSATDNTLSFEAIDLMSKLTGMRNGYLEGMTYQVVAGSNLVNAMRNILREQGFNRMVLDIPPTNETPIDINIDIGGTAYDLLTELRDVNPEYEMFFDLDGVFRFQQIPSGNESPEFGNEVWDKCLISSNLTTDFEQVKNYVEVIGKQVEPDDTATASYSGDTITVFLNRQFSSYVSYSEDFDLTWYIGFSLGSVETNPTELSTPITNFVVQDYLGEQIEFSIPSDQEAKIYYNNESYFIRMIFDTAGFKQGEFGGYLQPRAVAFELNPNSPFYVGEATNHISKFNNLEVDFADGSESFIGVVNSSASGDVANVDLTAYINTSTFASASEGYVWTFALNVELDNNSPIKTINLTYGDTDLQAFKTSDSKYFKTSDNEGFVTQSSLVHTLSNCPIYKDNSDSWSDINRITLDYNAQYLMMVQKVGSSLKIYVKYYPIPSETWTSPTTKVYSLPRFTKMVRGVCTGDDFDNIYSNDLAEQRAKYELYLKCRLHDTITIECVPLYWLDVNKVVSFKFGNEQSGDSNLWIIKQINTDFGINGSQSVTLMKYYPLYP